MMDLVRIRVGGAHNNFYQRAIYDGSATWANVDKDQGDIHMEQSGGRGKRGQNSCRFCKSGTYIGQKKCNRCGHLRGVLANLELRPASSGGRGGGSSGGSSSGGTSFVDSITKSASRESGGHAPRHRVLHIPLCEERPPSQVFSIIL